MIRATDSVAIVEGRLNRLQTDPPPVMTRYNDACTPCSAPPSPSCCVAGCLQVAWGSHLVVGLRHKLKWASDEISSAVAPKTLPVLAPPSSRAPPIFVFLSVLRWIAEAESLGYGMAWRGLEEGLAEGLEGESVATTQPCPCRAGHCHGEGVTHSQFLT